MGNDAHRSNTVVIGWTSAGVCYGWMGCMGNQKNTRVWNGGDICCGKLEKKCVFQKCYFLQWNNFKTQLMCIVLLYFHNKFAEKRKWFVVGMNSGFNSHLERSLFYYSMSSSMERFCCLMGFKWQISRQVIHH